MRLSAGLLKRRYRSSQALDFSRFGSLSEVFSAGVCTLSTLPNVSSDQASTISAPSRYLSLFPQSLSSFA